jgi:calcineurin-like phosphoesterase family protein
MAPSVNCLLASLAVGDLPEWQTQLPRLLAKTGASNYNLSTAEFSTFDLWWELAEPAQALHHEEHRPDGSGAIDAEVEEAFVRLAAIVKEGAEFEEVGYRHVRRIPGEGRFVVFSDHHMAFPGSRHDFFATSGNRELYSEILNEYADTGFTLIENGDVEELIIHEPMMPPPQAELEVRRDYRLSQLSMVILNHRALYDQINRQFVEQGRYIRIAGNHDQDNQDPRFLEMLRTAYPDLDQVYDFLIIEPTEANDSTFVVGHGHHFDTASTPKYSGRIGEKLSECLGWAYEGADRVWRWENVDGVQRWAGGGEPFFNTLVSDDAEPHEFTFDVEAALKAGLGSAWTLGWLGSLGAVAALAAGLAGQLSDSAFWEETFGHNIAWEYFQSTDPAEAVFNEVLCGKRWFKFRHLDEVFINEQLESKFRTNVPYLLLGHSHEPRHKAWDPAKSEQADHYLNSGAAGRFENLIWCVEITDGVPQVVAWHRPGGPESGEVPERRTYTPQVSGGAGQLVASDEHVPIPAVVEEEQVSWLEPVLQVMMSQP